MEENTNVASVPQQAVNQVTPPEPVQPPVLEPTPASLPNQPEKPKGKKKLFVVLGILIALILVALVSVITFYFTQIKPNNKITKAIIPTPAQKILGASLVLFDGEAEYKKGNEGWKTPSLETKLEEGDSVRVLTTGRAVINIDDGSVIRLNANSVITLVSLKPDKIEILNEKGEVYTRVVKSNRIFLVSADNIKYQSLGTSYSTLNTDLENGVKVYSSSVKVVEGEKETVVDEGNKYLQKTKKVEKIALADLTKDSFAKWNKQEDEKISEFKDDLGFLEKIDITPVVTKAPILDSGSGIWLTAVSKEGYGVKFSWKVSGVSVTSGFKLVKSESANPVYPGNDYQYITDSSQRAFAWNIADGKTYHFRICTYVDGKCQVYSNDVTQTAPSLAGESSTNVKSIIVKSDGGNNISWSVDGYSKSGYKIVFSHNQGPTYPTRDGDKYIYLDNPDQKSTIIDAFSGAGKYYVRVCEYLGSSCGVYSNQIEINL